MSDNKKDDRTVESVDIALEPGLTLAEVELERGLMSEEERKVKIKELPKATKFVIESLKLRQKMRRETEEALGNINVNSKLLAKKAFYLRTFIAVLKEELSRFSVEIGDAKVPSEIKDWLRRVCGNFDRYLTPAINNFDQVRLTLDKECGGAPTKKGKM